MLSPLEPEVEEYVLHLADDPPPIPVTDWVQHYADLDAHLVKRREDLDRAEAEGSRWWDE